MLTFYYHPASLYCVKVHLFLEESGQPYTGKLIDFGKNEYKNSELLTKNPVGKVPVIEDGEFCLSESNTIVRYLAQKWQLFSLYPSGLQERAKVEQWMDYLSQHICEPLSDLIWYRHYAPKLNWPIEHRMMELAVRSLQRNLPALEHHLIGRNYFAGPEVTLADLTLLPFVGLAAKAEVSLSDFPRLQTWLDRLAARESWKKVKPE